MFDKAVQNEHQQITGRLNAEIQLRHQMRLASEKMEMYELFEQATLQGSDYCEGFQAGFQASQELIRRHKI